jgi:hypothetical protein
MNDPVKFYQLVNTLLYKEYSRLPIQIVPDNDHLTTDRTYNCNIKIIIAEIAEKYSNYIPKYQWVVSPFNNDKVVPCIGRYEAAKMFDQRKERS